MANTKNTFRIKNIPKVIYLAPEEAYCEGIDFCKLDCAIRAKKVKLIYKESKAGKEK